jgi:uncharacterized protein YcbK (DUF882 family)
MPEDVLDNIKNLAKELQKIREHIGKSIRVNSGYRCIEYNRHIGSNDSSQHVKGKASDIAVEGLSPEELLDEVRYLKDCEDLNIKGIGIYNTFLHLDTRKNPAYWDYRT